MNKPTGKSDNLRMLRERKYTQREAAQPQPGPIHRRMAVLAGEITKASERANATAAKKAAKRKAKKR